MKNEVTPTCENKMKSSAVSPLAIITTSKPEGEFPVVNCLCIGDIDGRCVG